MQRNRPGVVPGTAFRRSDHRLVRSLVSTLFAQLPRFGGDDGERNLGIDHSTIGRWVLRYAGELNERIRHELWHPNRSWRVDETYVRVAGRWTYLYRAIDSRVIRSTSCSRRTAMRLLPSTS